MLRTSETQAKYDSFLAARPADAPCGLCADAPIKQFAHWKILKNNFPYDQLASQHDLLVPLRHAAERDLTREEFQELLEIKHAFLDQSVYDTIMESTERNLTVPGHFHLHLIVVKK